MNPRSSIAFATIALSALATATACGSPTAHSTATSSNAPATSTPPITQSAPASPSPAPALPSADPTDYLLSIRMTAKLPGSNAAQLGPDATTDAKLLEVGQHVCTELRNHVPPVQVEKELESPWTRSNALVLLGAASGQFSSLCPDQHDAVQAYLQTLL